MTGIPPDHHEGLDMALSESDMTASIQYGVMETINKVVRDLAVVMRKKQVCKFIQDAIKKDTTRFSSEKSQRRLFMGTGAAESP